MTEFRPEVVIIEKIEKHPNADFLDICTVVNDYPVITKSGEFALGEKVGYIPIDAIVPSNEQFHFLSKLLTQQLENYENLTSKYDTEVKRIENNNNIFNIFTEKEQFQVAKILIATGRSGWRWSTELIESLDIPHENKTAKIGVFLEFPVSQMKDFNFTNCKLLKENFEVGPFFWQGTIIPEDHADLILSSFRSNEERWKTEKIAFPVSYSFSVKEKGTQETTRLGQLALLLLLFSI
jgi:hypothetical protein